MTHRRTILVACIGTSPAVLTETVWALAHRGMPVVPAEIVVLTTKTGEAEGHRQPRRGLPGLLPCMRHVREEHSHVRPDAALGGASRPRGGLIIDIIHFALAIASAFG